MGFVICSGCGEMFDLNQPRILADGDPVCLDCAPEQGQAGDLCSRCGDCSVSVAEHVCDPEREEAYSRRRLRARIESAAAARARRGETGGRP